MPVDRVYAGMAVADFDSALGWYELLLGRPADARPMDGLAEWYFGESGALQLMEDADRGGRSLLTVEVGDLAAEIDAIRDRGIDVDAMDDTSSDVVRFVTVADPEGNLVTLVDQR